MAVLIASLLGAVLLAAAPLDAAHATLLHALAGETLTDGCSAAEQRAATASAAFTWLGRIDGSDLVLASVHGSCMCGQVNCPWFVLRLGGTPAVLLSTIAFAVDPVRGAETLPRLRERSHDSALVTDETVDAFRGGRFAIARRWPRRATTAYSSYQPVATFPRSRADELPGTKRTGTAFGLCAPLSPRTRAVSSVTLVWLMSYPGPQAQLLALYRWISERPAEATTFLPTLISAMVCT